MSEEEVTPTQYMSVLQNLIDQFIQDLRELGQTEIACGGSDYTLTVKIEPKEPQ